MNRLETNESGVRVTLRNGVLRSGKGSKDGLKSSEECMGIR